MIEILLICIIVIALIWAGIVDLKEFILPNELIIVFVVCACSFHAVTQFEYLSYQNMVVGGLAAGGLMLLIRWGANTYYQTDAMGLGDVKLLAAAGIWLGVTDFMMALSLGAMAGLIHGVFMAWQTRNKDGKWPSLSKLTIPAGPGFIVGILITGAIAFHKAIF